MNANETTYGRNISIERAWRKFCSQQSQRLHMRDLARKEYRRKPEPLWVSALTALILGLFLAELFVLLTMLSIQEMPK